MRNAIGADTKSISASFGHKFVEHSRFWILEDPPPLTGTGELLIFVGMAVLTTAQEFAAVREAIQTLTTTGRSIVSFSVGDLNVTYSQSQLPWLEAREIELARRLNQRNIRKRTSPDFDS